MIAFLRTLLEVFLKVAGWLPSVRRARCRKAFHEAAMNGDEAAMNKLWQEMEDGK